MGSYIGESFLVRMESFDLSKNEGYKGSRIKKQRRFDVENGSSAGASEN